MQSRTLLVVLLVASIAFASPESEKFKDFMKKYGKRYVPQEIPQRYNTFKENLKIIESLNAKHNRTRFGITKFADMSTEEFKRTYLSAVDMKTETKNLPVAPLYSSSEIEALPTTWDWRTKNAVTPVKNQGACGSCWSFSTTGNVEGQWAIKTGQLVGLSEQFLVDCDHHCMIYEGQQSCDAGCEGGLMPNAFAYIIQAGGIDSEASYPYEGIDDECRAKNSTVAAKISNWTMIANDEDQMAAYLYKNGPVSIAVDAQWWQFYEFGVFEFPWCGDQLDHGVLIVGFDQEVDDFGQTIEFWWVKNSWGADWGYNGYIKLERGSDQCGDNLFPCSSIA